MKMKMEIGKVYEIPTTYGIVRAMYFGRHDGVTMECSVCGGVHKGTFHDLTSVTDASALTVGTTCIRKATEVEDRTTDCPNCGYSLEFVQGKCPFCGR